MLERKKHKESGLWLFYVGFNLDVRLKLLGSQRLKVLSKREGWYRPQPRGQLCPSWAQKNPIQVLSKVGGHLGMVGF